MTHTPTMSMQVQHHRQTGGRSRAVGLDLSSPVFSSASSCSSSSHSFTSSLSSPSPLSNRTPFSPANHLMMTPLPGAGVTTPLAGMSMSMSMMQSNSNACTPSGAGTVTPAWARQLHAAMQQEREHTEEHQHQHQHQPQLERSWPNGELSRDKPHAAAVNGNSPQVNEEQEQEKDQQTHESHVQNQHTTAPQQDTVTASSSSPQQRPTRAVLITRAEAMQPVDSSLSHSTSTPVSSSLAPQHAAAASASIQEKHSESHAYDLTSTKQPLVIPTESERRVTVTPIPPAQAPHVAQKQGDDDADTKMKNVDSANIQNGNTSSGDRSNDGKVTLNEGREIANDSSSAQSQPQLDMSVAWSTLGKRPHLDSKARAHIEALDRTMSQVCNYLLRQDMERRSMKLAKEEETHKAKQMRKTQQTLQQGELMSLDGESDDEDHEPFTSPSAVTPNVDHASHIHLLLQRVGAAFCQTGVRVVQLFLDRAREEERIELKNEHSDVDGPTSKKRKIQHSSLSSSVVTKMEVEESASTDAANSITHTQSASHSHQLASAALVSTPTARASSRLRSKSKSTSPSAMDRPGNKNKKRKRGDSEAFSPAAVSVLRRWLQAHIDDPYPDAAVKISLAEATGLTYDQVQHWFINARMRFWRPLLRHQQQLLASGVKVEDLVSMGWLDSFWKKQDGDGEDDANGNDNMDEKQGKNKKKKQKQHDKSKSNAKHNGNNTAATAKCNLSDLSSVAAKAKMVGISTLTKVLTASASKMPLLSAGLARGLGFGTGSLSNMMGIGNSNPSQSGTGSNGSNGSAAASNAMMAAALASFVPRSGRSYMVGPSSPSDSLNIHENTLKSSSPTSSITQSSPSGDASTSSGNMSSSSILPAELLAASTLALNIAASYQTPHSYPRDHPLNRTGASTTGTQHRCYKSGGPGGATKEAKKKKLERERQAAAVTRKQQQVTATTPIHSANGVAAASPIKQGATINSHKRKASALSTSAPARGAAATTPSSSHASKASRVRTAVIVAKAVPMYPPSVMGRPRGPIRRT